ncbi:MAG: pyruvate, phosphate dikinase, partial [Candidatus Omnitrophica bacterium]|nr:pyruvate, phosphate dikinase [Candidatus Omnitrophota bacterium]
MRGGTILKSQKRPAAKTAKQAKRYVYFFGAGKADGQAGMKTLLGGKGANLAEMTNLGVPVPPGFTISTEACLEFYDNNKRWPPGLEQEIDRHLHPLEAVTKKGFGDPANPLLVSVRSGAAVSMPGMMDTILNLGLNDETVKGLIAKSENPRFAYDAYRRFVQMFGDVVLGVEHHHFEDRLTAMRKQHGVKQDPDLPAEALKELVGQYKALIRKKGEVAFPENPRDQLRLAINAVFQSWNNQRAITYRNLSHIPHSMGTAVNVQSMVFGNLGDRSLTGVCFTRNPSTGERVFYGEYLVNAQGEDVVAGIRTPQPIDRLQKQFPATYKQLLATCQRLERHYKEMQDLEFTVEEDTLYLLQTRTGKRTAQAAVRIAVEMVQETLLTKPQALLRVNPEQLDQLLHPTIDPKAKLRSIAKGLPASPGAAVGRAVFTSHRALELGEAGQKVILVRKETSPEDIGGMAISQGILTATGGMTSHAAVVGRGMGKCCVVGCSAITVREEERLFSVGDLTVREGDAITINGSTGEVILGEAPLVEPELTKYFRQLLGWADQIRRLGVRANADTPTDAKIARGFGAEGIGLCRTEHMFFGEERLPVVREMILAQDQASRERALAKLLPFQKDDFLGIFEAMAGFPVTIRLLDPPLHEFVPQTQADMEKVAQQLGVPVQRIADAATSLHEFNPMLGHRGCRLGVTYPEIYAMQARAIIEAACEL